MTSRDPQRWAEVERLYHEVRGQDAAAREAFLANACAGDNSLRDEVEALLRLDTAAERFLTRPALEETARTLAESGGGTMAGRQIHGYAIQSLLGTGGMGEIYLARDLRLGREVALKILLPVIAADPAYRQRLEAEARSASVLNHPNIVTIYGVGEEDDISYIAMERVHGRTLREIIASADLAIPSVLDLAVQLTDALAFAHDNGIIHRDLKPDNVMVTPDGRVKVLDFGIAKRDDEEEDGSILGTLGYMSPEQADGRRAGPQSDQFSFGAILYELLTSRRAFDRPSRAETLDAIQHEEPEPIATINPNVSPPLCRVVAWCLAKDPARRYPRSRDLAAEVRDIRDRLRDGGLTRRDMLRAGSVAAGVIAAAAGIGWWMWPRSARVNALAILPFDNSSHEPDLDPLCEGLTDHLIRSLYGLPAVRVMPRSLVANFRRSSLEPREFGRQIGADSVMTGGVARYGSNLTIWAALVEVVSGKPLWWYSYTRPLADLQATQAAIVGAIAHDGIQLQLSAEDRERLERRETSNPKVYELYLQGTFLHERQDDFGEQGARECLKQAVELDPSFARAYAVLASTYVAAVLNQIESPAMAWPAAQEATKNALRRDADLPDAHAENAAFAFFYQWDWQGAEREWALAARSRYAGIYPMIGVQRALQQWALGHTAEAVRVMAQVRELDPLSPVFLAKQAHYFFQDNQPAQAAEAYRRALLQATDEQQDDWSAGLAEVRRALGQYEDAIAIRRRLDGGRGLDDLLARARGEAGYQQIETAVARLDLDQLADAAAAGMYISPIRRARLHAVLGEGNAAFRYLEEAFDVRDPGVVMLRADRAWQPLRADPRHAAAVARLKLPEPTL